MSVLPLLVLASGTEYSIYLITAVVGCTLLGLQLVLLLFGLGHDGDVDADADVDHDFDHGADHGADGHGNAFFKLLSLKALCAFSGLFGLTGLALYDSDFEVAPRVGLSVLVGSASFVLVLWLMRGMTRLTSSGTVNVRNAVGRTGSVYLRIPEEQSGAGKVTVMIQGRTMEFPAVTDGEQIATGAQVMVSEVVGEETLKVVPL